MVTPIPINGSGGPRGFRERRAAPRTARNIRVLLLSDDCALDEPYGAWITDTSQGGVRLRIPGEGFPVGTLLFIRGPFATPRVPWTVVRVKHCRRLEAHGEVGCEFVRAATCDTTRIAALPRTRVG
jgi:hypothetical protein